ncbi:RagB/SusD family nutrient uptake outer membrane protein [Paraflavisolibacter sp. H34]|uniref:RagB/SusD family nutrient uptake outer membrane protein n=1 Tax=Huijunlia imazamoxiresistens TaxID=3127457 RepID=UPI003018BE73
MKRSLYISLLVASALGYTGCQKFLNTEPTDTLTTQDYYDSETKLTGALAGVYDIIGSAYLYGDYLFSEIGASTDEGFYARSGTTTGIMVNNFDFTNDRVRGLWADCYRGIDRANNLLANSHLAKMEDKKRQAIVGEAQFLRGYYYFLLATYFGGVPLRLTPTTTPENPSQARASVKEVYDQILKDMTEAEGKVAPSSAIGYASRVSKTVVQGVLARVCLHMAGYPLQDKSKYADALAWAKKVKESGEHALLTSFDASLTNSAYSQIFINHARDVYEVKESMWEADFKGNRTDGYTETGRVGNTIGITMTSTTFMADTGYSYGFIKGTGKLYNLYGAGDLRRDWVLTTYTYNATTGARVPIAAGTNAYGRDAAKWRRSFEVVKPKNQNHSPINYPILRYSDVLLMLAEADNQANNGPSAEAYEAVNQVRRRAYGLPLGTASATADLAAGLTKDQFQQAIEDERARELCFESLRRQDLVRWGKLVQVMNATGADMATNGGGSAYGALGGRNISQKHLLFPIPSSEMALNKAMIQNPGW